MVFQKRTGPFVIWSFAIGADTPTQTFPEATGGAVRESRLDDGIDDLVPMGGAER